MAPDCRGRGWECLRTVLIPDVAAANDAVPDQLAIRGVVAAAVQVINSALGVSPVPLEAGHGASRGTIVALDSTGLDAEAAAVLGIPLDGACEVTLGNG